MAQFVKLHPDTLKALREVNPRLMSYNVEFAEVTGGTFWKAYTPGQVAGTEEFYVEPSADGIASMYKDLMQVYPPIDLYNEKLRKLAKNLGPAWVRVSGTWATKTYYDFDGTTNGNVPEGYLNVLTKEQWIGVLDFVKEIGAKLMISMANCPGLHSAEEPWNPSEAEKIFGLSKEYGVPISAAEFANEPNMLEETGFPKGYTAADYRRDQDLFFKWLRANYPDCICVGPSSVGEGLTLGMDGEGKSGGVEQLVGENCSTADLLEGTTEPLDVFSYHYYNGVSERLASVMPQGHWQAEEANTESYLDVALNCARVYVPTRDKYCPGGEMWVTESGDAGGGGDTWASTYLDVFRTLNELGGFATITNGVIFHNTLASSDYGFLARQVFDPRPNYFAVLLWNRLMGTTVYDTAEPIREGAHVFAHSRKDGKEGVVYLVINNSLIETTTVELPKDAERYTLAGEKGNVRATVMTLNDKPLVLGENNSLPELAPVTQKSGTVELAPATCTFFVI
ncbi:MAG: beta-glucuronidase [Clostridiales bacterium]|nr:beta-glucuronidase [Roseburia sp.]MDD7636192.1 beta-glucuronidase [Clostridiales bacterium]MDY4111639.1 beta-glucuronidase [Roseburia sp.]